MATAVLTDFDGTLSPIVAQPDLARPLAGVGDILRALTRRFATVAVISGRPASFLAERLGDPHDTESPGPQLFGLYGLEWVAPDGGIVRHPEAGQWGAVIDEAMTRLGAAAPSGVLVEGKGLALTVHWRRAPEAEPWANTAVSREAEQSGLVVHPGRRSLELRPPLAIDKGSVTRELAGQADAACYFGDDIGDLPAYAALAELATKGARTVAIAVADRESDPSLLDAADLVLNGPAGALEALSWLASAPRQRAASS